MQPNFIIGGATTSGTSFLTHLLNQHADIYLPKDLTEPHFFSVTSWYENGIEWYKKTFFSNYNNEKAIGERSTSYFHFPEAPERLKQHFPHLKLIFVLRNPVDRAYAHYRYMVLRGMEPLDFSEALVQEKNRFDAELRHHEYAGRSMYGKQLEWFLKFFPFEQILIVNSEKLRVDTDVQLKRITDFLEIEPLKNYKRVSDFPSPSVKDRNVQVNARTHFGRNFKFIVEAIRHKNDNIYSFATTDADKNCLSQVLENLCDYKEPLSNEIRNSLEKYFMEDQAKFFEITQNRIDFKTW